MSRLRVLFFFGGLTLIGVGAWLVYEPAAPLLIGFLLWADSNELFDSTRKRDE